MPSRSAIQRIYDQVGIETITQKKADKPRTPRVVTKPQGPAIRARSKTSEDDDLPLVQLTESAINTSHSARSLRSQNHKIVQIMTDPERQLHASNKKPRLVAPADVMDKD